jgi:elongation factor G
LLPCCIAHGKDYKINIIDTPGYDDFSGEVISALRVVDTGVILLDAAAGVEVGTDIIWEYTETFKTPTLFVVNKLDLPDADFDKTLREARSHFGANVVAVQYPVQVGENFNSIVDVLNMVLYKFPADGGKPEKLAIPEKRKRKKQNNSIRN